MTLLTAARAAFIAALAFTVTMALLPQPPDLAPGVGDKYMHMLAFATLAGLARAGWPSAPDLTIAERLSFLGAMIEVFQSIPALHRDCDPLDWAADTAAVLAVLGVVRLIRRR